MNIIDRDIAERSVSILKFHEPKKNDPAEDGIPEIDYDFWLRINSVQPFEEIEAAGQLSAEQRKVVDDWKTLCGQQAALAEMLRSYAIISGDRRRLGLTG